MYLCKHLWNQYFYVSNIEQYDLSQYHARHGYSSKIHFWMKTLVMCPNMKAVLLELRVLACCFVLLSNSTWNIIHTFKLSLLIPIFIFFKCFVPMHVCMSTECVWVLVEVSEAARSLGFWDQTIINYREWVQWTRLGPSEEQQTLSSQSAGGFCMWLWCALVRPGGSQNALTTFRVLSYTFIEFAEESCWCYWVFQSV